ncbi:small ribosomal subunit Rsm22 family protein [Natronococcus jeotgali]|uniref:Type 12 methyltransferase n=1 Tax=Natronococcus jeotgali DSM 18795 TaxID=1227498 RepID=L9WRF9_9EURY|nr:class I SAM-dependent methyltransferase [Natronococcus jeotgali]ELY52045.1 type 12 methyltransferase [Natronococcus jeotgali DSM 18795]
MTDQREAIRSNAKYLRNVRPIDPEEICDYVEGSPHPAVVRQHLREDAVSLGLREREDGTFVPVGDEPVGPRRGPVERFPDRYGERLEDLLVERYGVDWHRDGTGQLLRSTIRRFKSRYLEGRPVEYDEDVAAGYAIYHLPGYYAAVQYALDDLAERGLLGRELRVLDVGAGVGGPALGLCDFLPDDAVVDYHAIEPGAAAEILEGLLAETGRNVHPTIHRDPVEDVDLGALGDGEGFDLVLACNVLSELADPEAVARSALGALAPDGTLLAMAPADKNTSVELRALERELEGTTVGDGADREVTVYGPTVRLWPDATPTDRGWSFDARPDLAVPSFQRRLDEATPADDPDHAPGEFVNVDVQFSYSLLRLDGKRRIEIALETSDWARMAETERHVTNRIDLAAAKLSRSLSADGANPLFKISDGSETVDHYAVLTRESALNRPLLEADYGEVLTFEGVLALWNDDEEAYNLVVDEETIVDRIG